YASLAGFICILAGLLFFRFASYAPTGSVYVPPSLENGELVPGHFESLVSSKEQEPKTSEVTP
ncbi:MAG: hypothetical protein VYE79_05170, partial [Pseudomonadota bacterium]|nr:hypothetical protein [Pseudomonadota bacterium]